jgi:hypothetical protein
VSVVEYDHVPHVQFELNSYTNIIDLDHAVDNLQELIRHTPEPLTGEALCFVHDHVFQQVRYSDEEEKKDKNYDGDDDDDDDDEDDDDDDNDDADDDHDDNHVDNDDDDDDDDDDDNHHYDCNYDDDSNNF